MTRQLPAHPNLEWLRKTAKQRLAELRASRPDAQLAEAQLDVAREYGFANWRALKEGVEGRGSSDEARGIVRLLRLVGAGRLDEARGMLETEPSLVNETGPHPFWGGRPQPLHVAIERGRPEMVDLLLAHGADVNGTNAEYDHWSPLMLASVHDRLEIREELLGRGARVGLAEALMAGDDGRVSSLLGAQGLAAPVPNEGSWVAFARTPAAIDALVARGASVTQRDHWGKAPIEAMSALGENGAELVRHLISLGAIAAPKEYARLGDAPMLERIFSVDAPAVRSDAVMVAAVEGKHLKLVRWLLERGASPDARSSDKSRHTVLHSAAWNGDVAMVGLLLDAGADREALDEEYQAPPRGWAETSIEVTGNEGCVEVVEILSGRVGV